MKFVEMLKEKNNKLPIFMGIITLIFAAIGIYTVFNLTFLGVSNLINQKWQNEKFAKFIAPVLMCNSVTFDNKDEVNNDLLLRVAINNSIKT